MGLTDVSDKPYRYDNGIIAASSYHLTIMLRIMYICIHIVASSWLVARAAGLFQKCRSLVVIRYENTQN